MLNEYNSDFKSLKKLDFKLFINIMAIILFGLLNIYLCTKGETVKDPFFYVRKQFIWLIISLIFMGLLIRFDYRRLYNFVPAIYVVSAILLILVWVPGIGATVKGERGWLNFRFFFLQPSEIAKFAIILMLAKLIYDMESDINNLNNLAKIFFYLSVPIGLILIEKDMGMAMVCFFIVLGMMFIAGLDKNIMMYGAGALIFSIIILWNSGLIFEHQKNRIIEFLNSDSDITGKGYQLFQGVIAIGSGGVWGDNLSLNPHIASGYAGTHVPEIQTDFIFTAVSEQWGLIGSLVLLLLYALLIKHILDIARRCKDKFGELTCVGIASYLLFAVVQNIGMTIHLLPITGITLPFVSYGGSSLFTTMLSMALVLSIDLKTKKLIFVNNE